jgi:hypothetical protein
MRARLLNLALVLAAFFTIGWPFFRVHYHYKADNPGSTSPDGILDVPPFPGSTGIAGGWFAKPQAA